MLIQHNIMAINAYRHYNKNNKALSGNLEKLSSGYKINRAGDDAAGLAISEKMRAQITGLDAAQKNVKDGVSLVKTAEGAMQEIQNMLNRMDYLATQSANGTYDDEVDRAALQKEVDQLKTEINRIADSANFNGIKLLDGSLGTDAVGKLTTMLSVDTDAVNGQLPGVGSILGDDTVLHNRASSPSMAQFGINLHNVRYKNDSADGKMTIKFGDDEITLTGGAFKATLSSGTVTRASTRLTVSGISYDVEGHNVAEQLASWADQFNAEADFTTVPDARKFTAAVSDGGDSIVFTAKGPGNVTATGALGTQTAVGQASVVNSTQHLAPANISGGLGTANDIDWTDTNALSAAGVTKLLGYQDLTATFGDGKSFTVSLTGGTAGDGQVHIDTTMSAKDVADAIQVAMDDLTKAENTSASLENSLSTQTGPGRHTGYQTTLEFTANPVKGGTNDRYQENTITAPATYSEYTSATVTLPAGQMTIGGKTYTVSGDTLEKQVQDWVQQFNADGNNTDRANWTATVNEAGNGVDFEARRPGSMADDAFAAAVEADPVPGTLHDGKESPFDVEGELSAGDIVKAILDGKAQLNGVALTDLDNVTLKDGATYKLTGSGYTLAFNQLDNDSGTAVLDREVAVQDRNGQTLEEGRLNLDVSGDYNVSTSFNKPETAESIDRLASTRFTLTSGMVKNGGSIFIGGTSYQFTTDKANKDKEGFVYIGDVADEKGSVADAGLEKVAERITVAARDNRVWTVDYNKTELTFTETLDEEGVAYTRQDGAQYDLTKLSEVERSLGIRAPGKNGTALTMQIGDTSEAFNQMKVSVGDMHVSAMGTRDGKSVEDVDIGTQAGAAEAINVIKDAVDYVSSVRGDLGAIQNRLEHTQNNLSVMAENIQDAESTIRDTDVAEEMMSYVKNNILVQSAQAMLAQANQVPQGVLRLLG